MAKTYHVKYIGIFGPRYKYVEEFLTPTGKVSVQFDRETGIAKNVPEDIALRLCRSEAFELVGDDVPTKKESKVESQPIKEPLNIDPVPAPAIPRKSAKK